MSSELEDWVAQRERAPQAAARAAMRAPAPPPDQAAAAARASRDAGVGFGYAVLDPEKVKNLVQDQQDEYSIARAPRLADWVAQRKSHAPIARGALPELADIEHHITTKPPGMRYAAHIGAGQAAYLFDVLGGLWDKGKALVTEGSPEGIGQSLKAGGYDLAGQIAGGVQWGADFLASYDNPIDRAIRAKLDRAIRGKQGDAVADASNPAKWLSGLAERRALGWKQLANYTAPKVKSEELQGAYSGVRSLPASAASLLAGAYFKSAKVGAVLMGGLVGAGSYSEGRRQGLDFGSASLYGTVDGTIEAVTEFLPTERLLGHIGSGTGLGKRLVSMLVADIPGEQLATLGQDFNQWAMIDANKGKPFSAFIDERRGAAYETLIASVVGSSVITAGTSSYEYAANKMGRAIPRVLPAEDNAHFLNVLGQLSSANKVLSRDTQTFESFIRAASEGTEATDVYVDAAKLGEVFQQANLSPEEAHDLTGLTPGEIEQAVLRGEDIRIPIEQFAARIAQSPVGDQLIPHLRIDPDEMSVEEAKVYLQSAQEEFEASAERALADSQAEDAGRVSRDVVRDAIHAELTRAGRFNSATNEVYASVVANFYAAFGARLGKTAEELANEVALRVQSGENAAPTFDQPRGQRLFHGGRKGMTRADIQIVGREGQKQGKKGRKYGGFYATDQQGEASGYANMGQEKGAVYALDLTPGAVVEEKTGDITRLTEEQIAEYRARGVDVVKGKDPRGRTEYAIINEQAIANFGEQASASVNIGLDIPGGGTLDPQQARDALAAMGVQITGEAIHQSDSEQTLVAELSQPLTAEQLGALSAALGQEAIAQHLGDGTGMLEGPGKANWGDFNPEFFLNLDGSRLSATYNQSAAALQRQPLDVAPSNRVVRNTDVAAALDLRHQMKYGRALDPTDPADYAIMLDAVAEEYADQKQQADSGEAWYSEDIAAALDITTAVLPQLEDAIDRDIFMQVVALLSPQTGPVDNWGNAIVAFTGYANTGRFALSHPDGAQFGVASHGTGLMLFQHLIDTMGETEALLWLRSEHTGREMAEVRKASGIFKNHEKLQQYLPSETNLNESKLGVYMFGPKVGDFALNSAGTDLDAVTVDLWMARTFNRLRGRLLDVSPKEAAEGKIRDAVHGKAERAIIKQLVRDAAQQAGITPSAMQAALWYFEQRLYRNHGINAASTSFSDAAREAAARRGIDIPQRATDERDQARGPDLAAVDLGDGVQVAGQSKPEPVNPLDAFKRESFYPKRASRLADGTVVVSGVPDFYPDRLAKIAEQLGAKSVEPVADNDKRLGQGVPLWFTKPPVDWDGTIQLDHWGNPGIERTDPTRWGESGTLPNSERSAISTSLPRTYFGIASGQPGGYVVEFPGRAQYTATVKPEQLYDIAADPDGLKRDDGVAALERRIHEAGYIGYWSNNPQLGLVATVFEPLSVQPAGAKVYGQDAVFFSALERAIERSTQAKATGQQWIATLKKTPGIKQEELEWTGVLDFLADVEGPVTREAILELVRGGGVRVDEVVLGAPNFVPNEDGQVPFFNDNTQPDTQFASWSSDPQNPTYRELLITLPGGEAGNPARAPSTHWDTEHVVAHARFMDKQDADGNRVLFIEEVQSDWHQKGRDRGYETKADPKAVEAAQAKYDAALAEMNDKGATWTAAEVALKSALLPLAKQAQEANVAAVAARGGEVPLLEGAFLSVFKIPMLSDPKWNVGIDEYTSVVDSVTASRNGGVAIDDAAFSAMLDLYRTASRAEAIYQDAANTANLRERELSVARTPGGVPNAPFKTTWPALVMKRMIRWAAEHGYQKIAWTTGEQQAERYNLSQALGGEMTVQPLGNGTEVIFGFPGNPRVADTIEQNGYGSPMSNHGEIALTREQAVAVLGEAGGRAFDTGLQGREVLDTDADMRVGGEGMKQFYDRNLVNITNDLVKKHGAKVGGVALKDFGGESGTSQVFKNLARVKAEVRALVGPTDAPNGWTSTALDERIKMWTPEAVAERVAANRKVITDNIENLTGAIEDPNHPDRIEEAVPGYKAALAKRQEELAKFDAISPEEREAARVERLAELTRARDMLLEAENMETPPDKTTNAGFEITPELAEAAMGGFPLFQKTGAPRGQIAFGADITQVPSMISLLRGADLSTFLHETGHFFFEVLNHYASQPGAPADVVADRDAMLRYIGVSSVTEWENMTPEARRNGHETIARSFEAYLFEGRAPSLEMRSLFDTMRKWLRSVYTSLTQLKVELTDEVRGVFDRMLASEEAIKEVEADLEMFPTTIDKPEGVSDADWAELQGLNKDATAEAAQALERRSLRDMRYAGRATAREIKRLQSEIADQRKAMREEVAPEIEALPVYRAIQFLRSGKINGEPVEGEHKLYTPEVRVLLKLETGDPLPTSLSGMTSTENGIAPSQIAELFGYTSADHLMKDLLFASPLNDAIEAETDARMRERYGELNSPEAVQEAAHAAVHNDVRGRFVATELAALEKAPGKKRVLDGAARRLAEGMVAKLRIRDIRPSQYEAAERRAARAAQAAGTADLDEAVRQKRNQLFNFHAAKAAHGAVEEVKKARDYLTKFGDKKTRANIDVSYLDQIDQVLERYELRQVSNKEADRRKALASWIEEQQAMGFDPMLTPEMLDEIGRKPWRELTVEEMRDLLEGIKNIEHLGRLTKKLLTAKDKADLNDAAGEVGQTIRDNAYLELEENIDRKTWWENVKSGIDDFFAMHRKFANTIHVFDGNKYGGVAWERFVRGMNDAANTESVRNRDAGAALEAIFRSLTNTSEKVYIPEIGKSLSLEARLMIALNWGNETNRNRILDGEKWELPQVDAIFATLSPEHWDFAERVWAYLDSYKADIIAKERRVSGVTPAMVEAEPFQIKLPDGSLRMISGGYFPIKYDPDRSTKAEQHLAADIAKQMLRGAFTRATTRRGHLKERVATVKRPVRKDFGVIFEHVSQVIHDLSWHEYLIDANRLLAHSAVDSAVREHYGPATLRWMRKALEDIASGDVGAANGLERALTYIRSGASIAGLGWNLWTTLLQPIGLTQSWSRIGAKHVGRGIAELFGTPADMNAKVKWIYEVSPFMRTRSDTMQREINEIRNRVAPKSPLRQTVEKAVPAAAVDVVADSYFVLIGKAQLIADLPTWLGQYHKSLDAGEGPDRAVLLADQAVIDSQGSGLTKDLAGVQRGGPWQKLWTNFYSYFSATYNLMVDRTAQLRRVGPKDLPYFAVDVALLTFVPATLTSLMYQLFKGRDDDDAEEIVKKVAADNLNYMLGTMLGLREVGGAISGSAGYTGPAGARVFVEIGKFGKQVGQGELDEPLARSMNALAGVLLHYPAGQIDRTVRGLRDWANGDAGPAAPLVGPPAKQ